MTTMVYCYLCSTTRSYKSLSFYQSGYRCSCFTVPLCISVWDGLQYNCCNTFHTIKLLTPKRLQVNYLPVPDPTAADAATSSGPEEDPVVLNPSKIICRYDDPLEEDAEPTSVQNTNNPDTAAAESISSSQASTSSRGNEQLSETKDIPHTRPTELLGAVFRGRKSRTRSRRSSRDAATSSGRTANQENVDNDIP